MRTVAGPPRQGGAVIITVALALLFLLGFMGIALDLGRLFIVKTELQTAMDSCALAAAKELDGAADALSRATSAGKTAGGLNKVNLQKAGAEISNEDVTFSDSLVGSFSSTFTPVANAKYAKCTLLETGIAPWLLQAMAAFKNDPSLAASRSVYATAVATLSPAQTSCALPVAINPLSSTPPHYGYTPGQWIPSLYSEGNNGDLEPGHFGWANLGDVSPGQNITSQQVLGTGACNLTLNSPATPGARVGASDAWNSRFGLYRNGAGNPAIGTAPPDLTGYSYTPNNWPSMNGALSDFMQRRASNRSYGDTVDTIAAGNALTGLGINGSYPSAKMGSYAAGPNALATHGANRRLALAPVITPGSTTIADFACVLLLHPIDGPNVTVYLEYVGPGSDPGSPCSSSGLPGGFIGPLVPVLVQ